MVIELLYCAVNMTKQSVLRKRLSAMITRLREQDGEGECCYSSCHINNMAWFTTPGVSSQYDNWAEGTIDNMEESHAAHYS
jgi:hypothetical protein